jgi:hypothetical protein
VSPVSPVSPGRPVETPYGEGRLLVHRATKGRFATLVLSHGAGNGVEARDLAALATDLPRQGITVALFEQPWRVAGRRIATPPPTLDVGLTAAVGLLRPAAPFVLGGRSAGARSAARSARPMRWLWWSRRPWNGSCARWRGIPEQGWLLRWSCSPSWIAPPPRYRGSR